MALWKRPCKVAMLITNAGFVCCLAHLLQEQRKGRLASLEVNRRFLNQDDNILQRLGHLDWNTHNVSKSVEAFRENIKQIEHDLKLQDNSKTEVRKADNAKEEKIVHHLLYPHSVFFKCWGADLREEEQTVAQNLFLSYGYNVYLGDHLPLDRPIRDTRSPRAAPILSRLKEDPVFDNINFDDTELLQYSVAADGFDWALWCLYERLPAERYALKDETAPVWPGSVKVKWKLCPVQESLILERAHKPYLLDSSIAVKRNPLGVAEARMGDYKYIVYFAWNLPIENPGIDFGNVSSRKELKKKLNCKGFGWYIKNIYPNLIFLPNIVGYGTMKNTLKEDICIDQGPLPGKTPIIYPNHARSPQHVFYHSAGEMYVGGLCARWNTVDRYLTDPGSGDLSVLEQCETAANKGLNLHWDFKQVSAVINRTKRCLEITANNSVS